VDLVAQATEKAAASLASANTSAASATSSQNYSIAAGNSATTATNQAASATTSASNAATSATSASTSATNAATSATTATTQASTATTQATNSSNSASAAATSATAAATSATNAASSATAAATSASNAAATLSGAMVKASNLSDVANVSTARTNLGLTALATTTPGTNVATALGVAVGSAGAFVTNGGALGTPSSGNLANCTFPTLNQNTTGTAANVTGTVAVANGGTGLTSLTAGYIPYGNGGGALLSSAALTFNGTIFTISGTSVSSQVSSNLNWNFANLNLIRTASNVATPRFIGMPLDGDSLSSTVIGGYNAIWGVYDSAPTTGSTSSALNGGMIYGAFASHRWHINGSERMRIDSVGNVGIGTTSPVSNLEVSGNNASGAISARISNLNSGGGASSANLNIYHGSTTSLTLACGGSYTGINSSSSSAYMYFATANTERMRIDSTGRVGIGSTPNASTIGLTLGATATGGTAIFQQYLNYNVASDVTGFNRGVITNIGTNAAAFTLSNLEHFYANQGILGNGSIVGSQFGFSTVASLTGATNNYGFYSAIPINPGAQGLSPATISTIASSGTTTTVVTTAAHGLASTQSVTVAATANATALVSGVTCTILTVGTTDFTLIGAASNTVGVSFTATGAGTGTGTVRINQQGSGKAVTVVDATTFTYTATTGTYAAITASGSVTPNTRFNIYSAGTAPSYFAGGIGLGTTNPRGKIEMAQANSVSFAMTNTAAALDNKTWDVIVSGTNYAIRTLNDIYSAASTAYVIGRTDNLVTSHIWYTSNAERMRIDSSGNVGIGSSSPSTSLTVGNTSAATDRTVRVTNSLMPIGFDMHVSSGGVGGYLWVRDNSFMSLGTNNTERMRIDSSGLVAIGSTTAANTQLQLGGAAPTAGTASYCINVQQTIPSGSTAAGVGYSTTIATQAASFNCGTLTHFNASLAAIGAGSTITNQYGFIANSNIIGATNNYAFFGNIPSGTGRWNFYAGGTAANYFAGVVEMKNVASAPTSIAAGNGVLYVEGGALKYRGSSGTVTTIAAA
jgi:hypothetical protein